MAKPRIAWLIALLLSSCVLAFVPLEVKAQGQTTNLSLTFHAYSVVLNEPNGSLVAYDGADGLGPVKATADTATLNAQITGSYSGFPTYTGMVVWVAQLPCDVHVSGSVAMKVYLSSTYKPGFLSGAGYGMGIVDFDESNRDIKEFYTEGPQAIGSSPFTSTPTAYSLSTNVDYVFKKGHSIGFFVGVGSTDKGFTATVYFDSADKPSGATLPIIDTTDTQTTNQGAITVTANSALLNLQYDQATRTLSFKAQGIKNTPGTATIDIPKTTLSTPFTVTQGTKTLTPTLTDSTSYQLTFTYTRNDETIKVVGAAVSQGTDTPTSQPTSSSSSGSSTGGGGGSSSGGHSSQSSSAAPSPEAPEATVLALLFLVAVLTVSVFVLVLRKSATKLA